MQPCFLRITPASTSKKRAIDCARRPGNIGVHRDTGAFLNSGRSTVSGYNNEEDEDDQNPV